MIFDFVLRRIRRALTSEGSNHPSLEGDDLEASSNTQPVVIEFGDVIDLHSIPPGQVRAVVEDYVDEAHRRGVRWVRIIHGKGIGVQREMVRSILSQTEYVVDYCDAPPVAGGWGATLVTLRIDSLTRDR